MDDHEEYDGAERRHKPRRSLDLDGNMLLTVIVLIVGWLCGGTWFMATEHAFNGTTRTQTDANAKAIIETRTWMTDQVSDLRRANENTNSHITDILEKLATIGQKVESVHEDVTDIKVNMHRMGR